MHKNFNHIIDVRLQYALAGTITIVKDFYGPDRGDLRGLACDGSTLWSATPPNGWSSIIYQHTLTMRTP